MTYEDKVLEYITQPQNFQVAMEVAEAVQRLKEKVHTEFWPLFRMKMEARLANSAYHEQWKFIPFNTNRLKTEWETCWLIPNQPKEANFAALGVIFGQGGREGHYRLITGVRNYGKLSDPNHPALKNLQPALLSRDLTTSWQWWPGFKRLPYALEGGDFLLKFANNPVEAVEEPAEVYWQLFLDLLPVLEPINQELAK